MTPTQKSERKPLRLWPGIAAVVLQWLLWLGMPALVPGTMLYGMLGGIVGCGALVLVWWLFFSRAPWLERVGALVLMIAAGFATRPMLDKSIQGGAMGMLFTFYAIPTLCLMLVIWAVATRRLADGPRRATLVAAIVVGCGFWLLLRTDGITGEGSSQLAWRWAKTPEQQLLARPEVAAPPAIPATTTPAEPTVAAATPSNSASPAALKVTLPSARPASHTGAEWPGFRGAHRDDRVTGVRIKTDWAATPPVELWRRPVGPGWSSFAVGDGLIYTQEQRGDFEVVACYNAVTGKPVWTHRDAARFWESNGGPGPRGTPTLRDGRLYTFGATGIVNALDAADGRVVWTRNAATDTGAKLPEWGFSSSPLVVDDLVVVAASGRLAAYDLARGNPRWRGPAGGTSYSSPQLATIDGVAQVLLLNNAGLTSVALADGTLLWSHAWKGYPIIQPALTADGGILMAVTDSSGTRRLAVAHGPSGWTVEERWTSAGLKPYFNDFVVHDGHAYGFDGSILACIDLQDGKRNWKGGRYGHGQLLLLPDQNVLLVLSEEGEIALVAATPGQFTEIARHPAIEGKTWNHPVLAGDLLLVRNGQEMVAFRLSLAGT
jgi:outer membrane protein assembly factor BamB